MIEGEHTVVPVMRGFNTNEVIGWLRIRTDALPPTPNFVFSLGVLAKSLIPGGGRPEVGEYELINVAAVLDENYIGYLRQTGKWSIDKAYIIVREEEGSEPFGRPHDVVAKAGTDVFGAGGTPHPGFSNRAAAETYLESAGLVFSRVLEIEVRP